MNAATLLRRDLHRHPEVSNAEEETAERIAAFLAPTRPDRVLRDLGGHGAAFLYEAAGTGPTILLRAELDALPIAERSGVAHSSTRPGTSHMCGHDGHMAILAALGRVFGRSRPTRGRVVLLFQPAEETGNGAAGVIADPRFREFQPDVAFALHNLPGVPLGAVRLREGVVNCASRGLRAVLTGRTAHSSMPETGQSPLAALVTLLPALEALGSGRFSDDDFAMATVSHCRMGEPTFGIAPGEAEIRVTLRTRADERMAALCARAEALLAETTARHGLEIRTDYHEIFDASLNAPAAVAALRRALDAEGVPHDESALPMRASEDFGRFRAGCDSAMFFLGAGETHPQLHNPDYDFPDSLIPVGARIFLCAATQILGEASGA